MDLEQVVIGLMRECAELTGAALVAEINRETVLLESGLDSLGFATLIAMLEEELGIDPFTMTDDVIYPQTLGEFLGIYKGALATTGSELA